MLRDLSIARGPAAAFLLPGFASDGASFALAMIMMAAAMTSGTLDVAMNARVSVLEGKSGRPLMNLCDGLFSSGYACAALAAGLARESDLGPVPVFAAMGAVTLPLILQTAAAPVADPPRDETAPPARAPSAALLVPGGLIILVAFLAEQGTEGWSGLHLERTLGAGAAAGALGPAILGLTMVMGRVSGQAVARRYSEATLLRVAAGLAACGALGAAWAPAMGTAYLGFALLGLGVSVCAPQAFARVGKLVAPERTARAVSRIAVLGYAGFFVGPPMMSLLSEAFGLAAAFSAVALLLLAIPAALVPLLSRRETAAGRAAA